MSNFRNFDRDTAFLPPPSIDDWLPEKHLARRARLVPAKAGIEAQLRAEVAERAIALRARAGGA